jgi:hypothetical protein
MNLELEDSFDSLLSNNWVNLLFRITDTEGNMDRQEFMEFAKKSAVMKVNYIYNWRIVS